MQKVRPYAPTLARYALIVVGTKLSEGGWLPAPLAAEIAADPAMVEFVTGAAVAAGALVWFAYSKARAAIRLLYA
jgi:hypothetical protein